MKDIFDKDGALTASFLLDRGYCCGNGCRNCPYEPRHGGPAAKRPIGPVATLGTTEGPQSGPPEKPDL